MIAEILHYGAAVLIVILTGIGVGIADTRASNAALLASNQQPKAQADIFNALIIGLALCETAAILGLLIGLLMLLSEAPNLFGSIAELGIAFACGLSGLIVGAASARPVQATCSAIARQPFFSQKALNLMLVSQSILQTPFIFAFIISLLIFVGRSNHTSLATALYHVAAGICIGIGSIGPVLGLGAFAAAACWGVGINRAAYTRLFPFSFISQAIIETPVIFALIIALTLVTKTPPKDVGIIDLIKMISAAFCMAIATLSPGIYSGRTAQAAARSMSYNPLNYASLSRTSILAQALIEATAVYGLLVSLIMLFV